MPKAKSIIGAPAPSGSVARENVQCDAASGANLIQQAPEIVVLSRYGKPPLRFKGCRLTRHWARLSSENQISIELWQQINKGFVVSYSIFDAGRFGWKSIQVSNGAEAADCLENVCANLDPAAIRVHEKNWLWVDLHFRLCFAQRFNLLVSDVLTDWHSLPVLQEHV